MYRDTLVTYHHLKQCYGLEWRSYADSIYRVVAERPGEDRYVGFWECVANCTARLDRELDARPGLRTNISSEGPSFQEEICHFVRHPDKLMLRNRSCIDAQLQKRHDEKVEPLIDTFCNAAANRTSDTRLCRIQASYLLGLNDFCQIDLSPWHGRCIAMSEPVSEILLGLLRLAHEPSNTEARITSERSTIAAPFVRLEFATSEGSFEVQRTFKCCSFEVQHSSSSVMHSGKRLISGLRNTNAWIGNTAPTYLLDASDALTLVSSRDDARLHDAADRRADAIVEAIRSSRCIAPNHRVAVHAEDHAERVAEAARRAYNVHLCCRATKYLQGFGEFSNHTITDSGHVLDRDGRKVVFADMSDTLRKACTLSACAVLAHDRIEGFDSSLFVITGYLAEGLDETSIVKFAHEVAASDPDLCVLVCDVRSQSESCHARVELNHQNRFAVKKSVVCDTSLARGAPTQQLS